MSAAADHGRAWIGRGRWRTVRLLAGLAAGPTAWAIQLEGGYAISSYACFPRDIPFRVSPPPGWSGETIQLFALNVGCLLVAIAGAALAAAQSPRRPSSEAAVAGPVVGRTRFLARCGAISGLGFAAAILVNVANIALVPACWSIGA
jgi:hypothetical protein